MKLDPVSKEKRLETLAVLAGFCVVMALIKAHHDAPPTSVRAWVWCAFGFLFIGLFVGPLATLISQLWLKLAHGMGFVMSRVLMSVVFFGVLLPMALLRRAFTRIDLIGLKRKADGASYYTEVNRTFTARDLRFPW